MANELTLAASASFSKSGITVSFAKSGIQVTISGSKYTHLVQAVGNSAEALVLGDITTPGYCLMYNQDSSNYVEVRDQAGGADVVKVSPGKIGLFELATTTPFVIASAASGASIEYLLIEA